MADALSTTELEYALLASLLTDPRRMDSVADMLRGEHFSEPLFGRMFGLMVREYSAGNPVNGFTIRPYIEADPAYQEVGGHAYLANMTGSASLLLDVKACARQIREMSNRRELVNGLRAAAVMGEDMTASTAEIVDAAEGAVVSAADQSDTVRQASGADAMRSLLKSAETQKRSIVSSVLPSIDSMLGGMRPGQLVIGGGRPGMGKTAAALSYSLGAAQNGHGVLFVSLEMGATELAARMAADLAYNGNGGGVPYADINSDNPSPKAIRAMGDAVRMLEDIPFHILDAGSLTIAQLELRVRRFKRRFAARGQSLDLVVVDYLQLLRTEERNASAYESVREVSRRLKGLAKDHEVAVFALAQLSRAVEQRPDKRPVLSDLKESGQIEQDADAVIFFYRHEYYLRQEPEERRDPAAMAMCEGKIDFICGKRRNGLGQDGVGEFHGKYQAVRG